MEVRSRFIKLAVVACVGLGVAGNSWAMISLKKVQVTDGSQVDLLFDGKITSGQIQTEYFNDIIQISLTDVSVYPAKISSVSGMDLTKVFAYQYSPKLVRARFSVKGKAESYRNRVQVRPNGKVLSLIMQPSKGSSEEAEARPAPKPTVEAKAEAIKVTDDEKALLDRVMKSQAAPIKAEPAPAKTEAPAEKSIEKSERARAPLATGKPMPSPFRSLGSLAGVLLLFGGVMFVLKKFKSQPRIEKHKGFSGFIGKIASNMGINRRDKMIEVVANHYLGPKKSIAVVRVAGRLLVLGITNESINLITQLSGNAGEKAAENAILETLGANTRSAVEEDDDLGLDVADEGPSVPKKAVSAAPAEGFSDVFAATQSRPGAGVRAQIRNRLGSMKQL